MGGVEQREHRAAPADSFRAARGGGRAGAVDRRLPYGGGHLPHHAGVVHQLFSICVIDT